MSKDAETLLSRSVKEIIPSKDALRDALESGKKLRIYIGTDATGTSLHLGHATNYMILERFRRLGHEVIFLIGDFTSRIGDPTDKSDAARKQLTREEVVENTKTWVNQVRPIIDVDNKENPVKIMYNHEWLSKLTSEDWLNLASNFTVQQMIERDMFQERIKKGEPLYLTEFLYPLMQGYDSVAMDVDMEMCGNDQKFNALAGRTLLKKLKNKEKFVFITTLLENPKTGEKMMSKSQGTGVFLDWSAEKMFGGIMAQPDENMKQLFTDCTWLPLEEIETILEGHPKDAKLRLAFEITKLYHGEAAAEKAQENFETAFGQGGVPEDVLTVEISANAKLVDILLEHGLIASKTEFNRLEKAGAIREIDLGVYRIGKHRFIKVVRK
jgi:tyrosyl-tRNA synthetase